MRKPITGVVLVAVMFIVSVMAFPFMPERIPMHWNVAGEVDRYGGRLEGLLLAPLIGLAMVVLGRVLPRIDPRREAYGAFKGTYELIINSIILFMVVLHLVVLASALGWPVSVPALIGGGVGLLLAVLGNELGRVEPNWFVGIRTPWTLANPEIWRRTHRVGGRVMVVAGLAIAFASVFTPGVVAFAVTMAGVVAIVGFSFGYSYLLWRRMAR